MKLLGSREGGGHHVITKRRLLLDYSIKGINPFVPPIIDDYFADLLSERVRALTIRRCLLDFDGNERAGLHLRNSDLNVLHILLQQLQRKDLSPEMRRAASERLLCGDCARIESLASRNSIRLITNWRRCVAPIEKPNARAASHSRRNSRSKIERWAATTMRAASVCRSRNGPRWKRSTRAYVAMMRRLLSLHPETFQPMKLKIEELIPQNAMGRRNTIHNLQNYVVGLGRDGLVLKSDGSLDVERSFVRINYFDLLKQQTVRNNVQAGISNQPVDFRGHAHSARIARLISCRTICNRMAMRSGFTADPIGRLIVSRGEDTGQLQLALSARRQPDAGSSRERFVSSALIGEPTCRCASLKMRGWTSNGAIALAGSTIGTPTLSGCAHCTRRNTLTR